MDLIEFLTLIIYSSVFMFFRDFAETFRRADYHINLASNKERRFNYVSTFLLNTHNASRLLSHSYSPSTSKYRPASATILSPPIYLFY